MLSYVEDNVRLLSRLVALVLILGLQAVADPLILSPRGTTLTTGQFRLEAAFSPGNDRGKLFWFATGFQQLEINAIRIDNRIGQDETILGAQWNFLPETMLTPAISFGVRDAAFQSAEGLGVYAAVTRHLPIGEGSRFLKDFEVTAGIGVAGIRGPFASFEALTVGNLFAEAEYDSREFNVAVGWQPIPRLRLKLYTIRDELYYGAELVPISF